MTCKFADIRTPGIGLSVEGTGIRRIWRKTNPPNLKIYSLKIIQVSLNVGNRICYKGGP
jgi:hypothetical protein